MSAAYGANASPAGLRRTLRPARSKRSTPSSRFSAASAADTDGWVTISASAAVVIDPPPHDREEARELGERDRHSPALGGGCSRRARAHVAELA